MTEELGSAEERAHVLMLQTRKNLMLQMPMVALGVGVDTGQAW